MRIPVLLMLASHDPVDHVLPHSFFKLLPFNLNFGKEEIPLLSFPLSQQFYFTNHLLMTLVAAGLCLLIFPRLARAYAAGNAGGEPKAPRGAAMNVLELILQFIRDEVVRPTLKHRTDRFMPFLWTLFFFILFCNLLGMVPIAELLQTLSFGYIKHVGGTATGNLAITGGLAICAFFMIHVSGVREVYHALIAGTYGHHEEHDEHGESGEQYAHATQGIAPGAAAVRALPLYVWNFAPHVFKPAPGTAAAAAAAMTVADVIMWAGLLLLELLGAIIMPFALMMRLFANMTAGHIVLASILAMIFVGKSVLMGYTVGVICTLGCAALSGLELFVAFLQAYIFVFLTTLFISMSVAPEH